MIEITFDCSIKLVFESKILQNIATSIILTCFVCKLP